MTKKIKIYSPYSGSYGISVIVDKLVDVFNKEGLSCEVINTLDGQAKDTLIIPYASDPAVEMIQKGFRTDISFFTDAYSLGYKNKVFFSLKRLSVFNYDFIRSVGLYFIERIGERRVTSHFKNIVLVSDHDIKYLQENNKFCPNYFCLPNGAPDPLVLPKTPADKIRLGILSSWGHQSTAAENGWFVTDYFKRYAKSHNNVELILAGRGKFIEKYKGIEGVRVMGEVNDLNEFFSQTDMFIAVNPKGCGILNRVLDAFAYKTFVLGHEASFTGFKYMKNCYMQFTNYASFERTLDYAIGHPEIRTQFIENATEAINMYNNWDVNIKKFINEVVRPVLNDY